jgi:hypothetical protein
MRSAGKARTLGDNAHNHDVVGNRLAQAGGKASAGTGRREVNETLRRAKIAGWAAIAAALLGIVPVVQWLLGK